MSEKRLHVVSFRLTDGEAAHVDAAAATTKPVRSRQDWCRAACLHLAKAKVPNPPPPKRNPARRLPKADVQALGKVLAALGKVGGHTNQMAKAANQNGRLPQIEELTKVRVVLEDMRADLREALGHGHQG
ncbi:hypothetical protein [Caenispirillum bisanense]|uniref:Mobilisation protein (MobC) n=1 Tax=Caenispirillum bisanense TaxID=414052 RepID=A0A286H2K3_9PROT|nr:hypothetical protein [Caenispirillum bisanense]SOE01524.1 hypothetical protein SAMN05421508_11917 [Caenispirillum bisanense]